MPIKSLNSKSYILNSDCKGQSLVEILIAISVGVILIGAATAVIAPLLRSNLETRSVQTAGSLAQEYLDNIQSISESNWNSLYNPPASKGPGSQFYLKATSSAAFEIVSGATSTLMEGKNFTRYFSIENVNRTLCGVSDITGNATTSCFGGTGSDGVAEDPSTQKIIATVSWEGNRLITKTQYFIRRRHKVFVQTDWSGGPGQEGPISLENNKFASSSNINYSTTTGSIIIQF